MRRIPVDYDDTTLEEVRWDAERILLMFDDVLEGYRIFKSSSRNYHVIFTCSRELEQDKALYILLHTHCDIDYLDFVESRGFTIRITARQGSPAPRLLESNLKGGLNGSNEIVPIIGGRKKSIQRARRLRIWGTPWKEIYPSKVHLLRQPRR